MLSIVPCSVSYAEIRQRHVVPFANVKKHGISLNSSTHRIGSIIAPVHLPVVVDLCARREDQLARDVGLGQADLPPRAQAGALEVQLAVLGGRGSRGDGVGLELRELVRL